MMPMRKSANANTPTATTLCSPDAAPAAMPTGCVGDVEHVVAHGVRAVHRVHRVDRGRQLRGRRNRRERVERLDATLTVEDLALGGAPRKTQRAHEREAVELALGQRER